MMNPRGVLDYLLSGRNNSDITWELPVILAAKTTLTRSEDL